MIWWKKEDIYTECTAETDAQLEDCDWYEDTRGTNRCLHRRRMGSGSDITYQCLCEKAE